MTKSDTPKNERFVNIVLLFILSLALILRLLGLTWGVYHGNSDIVLHPDERHSLKALGQMDLSELDFNPDEAHLEGTFYYYLLSGAYAFFKGSATIANGIGLGNQITHLESGTVAVIIGRIISALAGALIVFLVYKISKVCKLPTAGALIASFCMAVMPIAVIHSQFMRPHIVGEAIVLIAVYILFSETFKEKYRYPIIGLLFGLAIATRYNMAVALIIPGMYILVEDLLAKKSVIEIIFNRKLIPLLMAVPLGFFIGDPYLFLQYSVAKPYLTKQSTFVGEDAFNGVQSILNFNAPVQYLTYLIPEGVRPLLTVGMYISTILMLFVKDKRKFTLPIISFLLAFLYLMSKGYITPIFARATLPMLPYFALAIAFAYSLITKLNCRVTNMIFIGTFLAAGIISGYYVVSYYYMINTTKSPITRLNEYLNQKQINAINIDGNPVCRTNIFTITKDEQIEINQLGVGALSEKLKKDSDQIYIYCIYDKTSYNDTLTRLSDIDENKHVTTYFTPDFPYDVNFKTPHDMLYPFTTFIVVEPKNSN